LQNRSEQLARNRDFRHLEAYFLGALLIAGLVGAMFESWPVFMIAAGVLIATNLHDGNIRP
jgi:hypothetical protein